MEKKITMGSIISNGFKIGLKNFLSLIGAVILWVLTIWIPYLNVGTTIAIFSIPLSMSKGNIISPTEIFKEKYRKYMGEYFMLLGLKNMVIYPALMFMIIPGIVISISYSLGLLLLIDKGLDPSKALSESNKYTDGYKWEIFLGKLVLCLPLVIPFVNFVYAIILFPVLLGANAHIYKELVGDE